ncbi:tyrosine--tRNA ligase [Candidatus Woesearchaeota archaeon]|nr:tyrosine--tRNA ligase [Candidatus Woesearchaeota archaeon]
MHLEERFNLIKKNTEEIITEENLIKLLKEKKNPVVYCGYEPSGPIHLGHFVTISKLMDFEKAGFKVKVLLADVHALLNKKGSGIEIKKEIENWKRAIKVLGLKAEIIVGSSFQFNKDYQLDVMELAQHSTINRGLKSMQEIARDIEHASISQLWYPLMQVVDIKYLNIDVAEGGLEQRKVHMIGKDMSHILHHDFIAVHTPLINSLKGPGEKMSKSSPGSGLSIIDAYEEIKSTIKNAYCPEKIVEDNPILQIVRFIIFSRFSTIKIERSTKFGGNLELGSYEELAKLYVEGNLHPLDLKNMVVSYLEKIINPIRKILKEKT